MEGLTKENFFDRVEHHYPYGMHLFRAWIDEQKEILGWNKIFQHVPIDKPGIVKGKVTDWEVAKHYVTAFIEMYPHVDVFNIVFTDTPKFHDVAFEFQFALLSKFIQIKFNEEKFAIPYDIGTVKDLLEQTLSSIEGKVKAGWLDGK